MLFFKKSKKEKHPNKKKGFVRNFFTLKNFFHYDNILASGLLFLFLFSLGNINFEALNPIGDAFDDVEITDVSFSHLGKNEEFRLNIDNGDTTIIDDSNIVIVNVGGLDKNRRDIAFIINAINMGDPKVVALDVFFDILKTDTIGDYMLQEAFENTKNLILTTEMLHYDQEKNTFDSLKTSIPFFNQFAHNGYANMILDEDDDLGEFNICRKFHTYSTHSKNNSSYPSFALKICQLFDSTSLKRIHQRNKTEELINFTGNIHVWEWLLPSFYKFDRIAKWDKRHFLTFEHATIINTFFDQLELPLPYPDYMPIDPSVFKNKIVLIGYTGNTLDIDTGEDKFFTPLNKKYVGKANKDMYGIVVHANIISTILRNNLINALPGFWMHFIGIFTVYFTLALFRPIYSDYKIWYDGITKFLGICFSLLILFVIGIIFDIYNYEIRFGGIYFGCILLAGDFLEIYHGLVKNLARKISNYVKKKTNKTLNTNQQ